MVDASKGVLLILFPVIRTVVPRTMQRSMIRLVALRQAVDRQILRMLLLSQIAAQSARRRVVNVPSLPSTCHPPQSNENI
jgi:hypothetical protein